MVKKWNQCNLYFCPLGGDNCHWHLPGLPVNKGWRLFMLHCRNEEEDLYSIELQINLTHFSFAFLLVPDATFFLHQFLFSSSSYQTSWTVFDTNCLYTPTCPVSPPPHQSCTVTPSLCCLRGKAVCLWLLLGQIADHLSPARLRTTHTIHLSLLLVRWG